MSQTSTRVAKDLGISKGSLALITAKAGVRPTLVIRDGRAVNIYTAEDIKKIALYRKSIGFSRREKEKNG